MMSNKPVAEVTQADRDAAAEWDRIGWYEYEGDWLGDLTEAFAAHRLRHIPDPDGLREALERIASRDLGHGFMTVARCMEIARLALEQDHAHVGEGK